MSSSCANQELYRDKVFRCGQLQQRCNKTQRPRKTIAWPLCGLRAWNLFLTTGDAGGYLCGHMLRFEIVQVVHLRGSQHQWRKLAHHDRTAAREGSRTLRGLRNGGRGRLDYENSPSISTLSCIPAKLFNMHSGACPLCLGIVGWPLRCFMQVNRIVAFHPLVTFR